MDQKIGLLVFGLLFLVSTTTSFEKNQPNIIFVLLDDVDYLTIMQGEKIRLRSDDSLIDYDMSFLRNLHTRSLFFEKFFSSPICTTSRCQILTQGRYLYENYIRFSFLSPDESTTAQLFKQNGYSTAIFGKWQLQNDNYADEFNTAFPSLSKSYDYYDNLDVTLPKKFGFDTYVLESFLVESRIGRYSFSKNYFDQNGVDRADGAYGPDNTWSLIEDYIDKHKNDNRPFLLYWMTPMPHAQFQPDYDHPDSPVPPETNDPKYIGNMLEKVDDLMEQLVTKIENDPALEETIIVITTDNSIHGSFFDVVYNGQNYQGTKGKANYLGTHQPMWVVYNGKYKNFTNGDVYPSVVGNIDFHGTFCDFARMEYHQKNHSKSWASHVVNYATDVANRSVLFQWYHTFRAGVQAKSFVTDGRYWLDKLGFYDTSNDWEMQNAITPDPSNQIIYDSLNAELKRHPDASLFDKNLYTD